MGGLWWDVGVEGGEGVSRWCAYTRATVGKLCGELLIRREVGPVRVEGSEEGGGFKRGGTFALENNGAVEVVGDDKTS